MLFSKFPILSSRILNYSEQRFGIIRNQDWEDTVTLINNHLESNKLTKPTKVVYEDMLKAPGEKV